MTRTSFAASALLASLLCSGMVMAQTAAPAAKAKPAAKPAAVAPAAKALPAADKDQLDAAERTLFGAYACEFDQKIDIAMNAKTPGYVDVKFKNSTFVGSSRVDLQACKLEYSIVSPK